MLPADSRMRRAADFAATVRHGRRSRGHNLIVSTLSAPAQPAPTLFGLVVGRSVGGSVVRHRVSRRLRAQLALRIERFPAGSRTVVRALPAAADASSADLGRDLDTALSRWIRGSGAQPSDLRSGR